MLNNILVQGFYDKNNVGDELFKDAFKTLFPQLAFTFTDKITASQLNKADAVFIGGGSFLNFPVEIEPNANKLLSNKPILYLGVGSETDIHPTHQELIKKAKLVNIRNKIGINQFNILNNQTICSPDLVYSLSDRIQKFPKLGKSILIIPSLLVVPQNNSSYWMHTSWNYFKSEFVQFLDTLVERGYHIDFLSLCSNDDVDDNRAAIELINHSNVRKEYGILPQINEIEEISKIISQYDLVLTQRYHGIVLSELCNVPYISIHHHDKLKSSAYNLGKFVSYYNLSKNFLLENFFDVINSNFDSSLLIERNTFEEVKAKTLYYLIG